VRKPTATPEPAAALPGAEIEGTLLAAGGSYGVLLYDEQSDTILYEHNPDQVFYAASLIKLPICLTAYVMADRGELALDELLVMEPQDKIGGTGSIRNDPDFTAYSISELCSWMLSDSDNTASNMLLDRIGTERVNSLMAELGATNTLVERRFFDLAAREAGRTIITNPHDMLLLLRLLAPGALLSSDSSAGLLDALRLNLDRSKIPARLPADVLVINKTGLLPPDDAQFVIPASIGGIQHDAAIVTLPGGQRYILVIMGADLPESQAAIDAMAHVSELIYAYEAELHP